MPYPMNSKYGGGGGYSSPYGQSSSGSSGSYNSLLLGRYDPYASGMGMGMGFPGRSPLYGSNPSYGSSSGYGSFGSGSSGSSSSYGSNYGYGSSSGLYGSPYSSKLSSFGSLATISEHSILPSSSNASSSGQRRLPRGYVPPLFPSSASPSNYTPTAHKKPAIFDTENIDVTTPRKPSTTTATPGEITREKTFGTIKRNRTVIRIRTNKLKDNPYLTEEEQKERAEERKKEKDRENLTQKLRDELRDETNEFLKKQQGKIEKGKGDKFREKFMIQSKKKKYSGYRRPTISDIRTEKDRLQKELDEKLDLVQKATDKDSDLKMANENGEIVVFDVEAEKERLEKVRERLAHLDRRMHRRYSKALKKAASSTTTDDDDSSGAEGGDIDRKSTVKLKKSSSKNIINPQNESETKVSPLLKRKATKKFFFPAEGSSAVQPEILEPSSLQQEPEDSFEKNILAHRTATMRKTSSHAVNYIQPRRSSITNNDVLELTNSIVENKSDSSEINEILSTNNRKGIEMTEKTDVLQQQQNETKAKGKVMKKVRKVPVTVLPLLEAIVDKKPESEKIVDIIPTTIKKPKVVKPISIIPEQGNKKDEVNKKLATPPPFPVNGIKEGMLLQKKKSPKSQIAKQQQVQQPQQIEEVLKASSLPMIQCVKDKNEEVSSLTKQDNNDSEKSDGAADKLITTADKDEELLMKSKSIMLHNDTGSTSLDKIKPKLDSSLSPSLDAMSPTATANANIMESTPNAITTTTSNDKPKGKKPTAVTDKPIGEVPKSKSENVIKLKPAAIKKQTSEPIIQEKEKVIIKTKVEIPINNSQPTSDKIGESMGKIFKSSDIKHEVTTLAPKIVPEKLEIAKISKIITPSTTPNPSPKLRKEIQQKKIDPSSSEFSFEKEDIILKSESTNEQKTVKTDSSPVKTVSPIISPKTSQNVVPKTVPKVKTTEKLGPTSPKKKEAEKVDTKQETKSVDVKPEVIKLPDLSPLKIVKENEKQQINTDTVKVIEEKVAPKKIQPNKTESVEKISLKPVDVKVNGIILAKSKPIEKVAVKTENAPKAEDTVKAPLIVSDIKEQEQVKVDGKIKDIVPEKSPQKSLEAFNVIQKPNEIDKTAPKQQLPTTPTVVETQTSSPKSNEKKAEEYAPKSIDKSPKFVEASKPTAKQVVTPPKAKSPEKVVEMSKPKVIDTTSKSVDSKVVEVQHQKPIEPKPKPDEIPLKSIEPKVAEVPQVIQTPSEILSKSISIPVQVPKTTEAHPKTLESNELFLSPIGVLKQITAPSKLVDTSKLSPKPIITPKSVEAPISTGTLLKVVDATKSPPKADLPKVTEPKSIEVVKPTETTPKTVEPKTTIPKSTPIPESLPVSVVPIVLEKVTVPESLNIPLVNKLKTSERCQDLSKLIENNKTTSIAQPAKESNATTDIIPKITASKSETLENVPVASKSVTTHEGPPELTAKLKTDSSSKKKKSKSDGSAKQKGVKTCKTEDVDTLRPKSPLLLKQEGRSDDKDNSSSSNGVDTNAQKPIDNEIVNDEEDAEDEEEADPVPSTKKCPRLHRFIRKSACSSGSSTSSSGSSTITGGSTSTTGSSGSGSSRPPRMPSPPVDDDDDDEPISVDKICPAKIRPKYRKYEVEDFQFLKVLGKGSFGKVLLAEMKDTDSYFAIKCLKKDVVLEDDDVECTMIERKVLLIGSKHPYLCHLFCTFQTESHLFFVMEYLNGGDLMFHIQQSGKFSEERAKFYGAEIVSGLKFLHKKGVMYRDLKLDNILLDYEGHIRIADFGMCKLQIYLDRTADTFCGTPDYMAPEIIKGLRYNQCVDWWAFGVLLYEMLVGQSPFSGSDEDELFWSICNEPVHFPRFLSKESKAVLERLLEKDASRRLGMASCAYGDIKNQVFFNSIDWDKLERRELDPPFRPKLKHPLDVQYFDTTFTKEIARLTPVDKEILQSMDQTQFDGFSYTNPHTTD